MHATTESTDSGLRRYPLTSSERRPTKKVLSEALVGGSRSGASSPGFR